MCEVRPALQFEQLIETMFALASDGKTNSRGFSSAPGCDRERHLRHGASAFPTGLDAADGARDGGAGR